MSFNVLTAEISHETNSFSIQETDEVAFMNRYVLMGAKAISERGQANAPLAGFLDTGRSHQWQINHVLSAAAGPSGKVRRETFDWLCDPIISAITLIAEVIESKVKPTQPWGEIGQTAFGAKPRAQNRGDVSQTILAIGLQDTDPCGLQPPHNIKIVGASSDHLIVESGLHPLPVGAEMTFQLNYSALVRLMTSPFVTKVIMPKVGVGCFAKSYFAPPKSRVQKT